MASNGGSPDRVEVLADAAITVLAREGMRGLTHRAVDAQAQLPAGSTSNRFRTRHDLVMGVVTRLADRDLADLRRLESPRRSDVQPDAHPAGAGTALEDIERLLTHWATGDPDRLHARLSLAVEGLRDPSIRDALRAGRSRVVDLVDRMRAQASRAAAPTASPDGKGDPLGAASSEQIVAYYSAVQWAQATQDVDITQMNTPSTPPGG